MAHQDQTREPRLHVRNVNLDLLPRYCEEGSGHVIFLKKGWYEVFSASNKPRRFKRATALPSRYLGKRLSFHHHIHHRGNIYRCEEHGKTSRPHICTWTWWLSCECPHVIACTPPPRAGLHRDTGALSPAICNSIKQRIQIQ